MHVRDAVESDADALADLADLPRAAAERLVRERTVLVAATDGDDEDADVVAFVAYDAWDGTIHVTRLAGDADAVERLLDEPRHLARHDRIPVEVVVLESESATRDAAEAAGFVDEGTGPMFEGERTRRYRWRPS